jgi:hypothetical protein
MRFISAIRKWIIKKEERLKYRLIDNEKQKRTKQAILF